MTTVKEIKSDLIDKIQSINNKDFLINLDRFILSTYSESEVIELTSEQKIILEMSEQDIQNNDIISQEEMFKRNLKWLNAM